MKEREFLKKLNSKNNENGSFTYALVTELIDSADNKPVSNNMFNRLFSKLFRVKSYEQIILDNFQTILDKTNQNYICSFLNTLMDNENLDNIVQEKFMTILQTLNSEDTYIIDSFMHYFRNKSPENTQFIEENVDEILENINPDHLFAAIQSMKGISDDIDNRLNKKLEENKHAVILSILEDSTKYRPTQMEDKREEMISKYVDTLEVMFDELLADEGKRMIDIKEIKGGGYSSVFEIGDKVIKVGGTRKTYNIPNHRRILQPLTRINFIDDNNTRAFACVEVAPKAEPNPERDETDEENLYSLWKELRQDGIVWTDIKSANIGRLRNRNIPTLNNEEMDVSPNFLGFDKALEEDEIEDEGWVILDTDYIYSVEDPEIAWTSLSKEFEKRYQQECQFKIAQAHVNDKAEVQQSTEEIIK